MYELLSNRNMESGFHIVLIYLNDITGGWFINGFLLMIWCAIAFGLYFYQQRTTAQGDFPVAVTTASFITVITTLLFRLIKDDAGRSALVSIYTMGVVFVISFLSVLWLWLSKK